MRKRPRGAGEHPGTQLGSSLLFTNHGQCAAEGRQPGANPSRPHRSGGSEDGGSGRVVVGWRLTALVVAAGCLQRRRTASMVTACGGGGDELLPWWRPATCGGGQLILARERTSNWGSRGWGLGIERNEGR